MSELKWFWVGAVEYRDGGVLVQGPTQSHVSLAADDFVFKPKSHWRYYGIREESFDKVEKLKGDVQSVTWKDASVHWARTEARRWGAEEAHSYMYVGGQRKSFTDWRKAIEEVLAQTTGKKLDPKEVCYCWECYLGSYQVARLDLMKLKGCPNIPERPTIQVGIERGTKTRKGGEFSIETPERFLWETFDQWNVVKDHGGENYIQVVVLDHTRCPCETLASKDA